MSLAMFGVMIAVRVCDSEINDNFGSESSVYSFYNNTEMTQPSDLYGRIVKSRANTHIALNFILFILLLGTAVAHLLAILKGPSKIEDNGNTIPISDSATMGQWGEKVDKVNKIPRRRDSDSIKPMKISVMGSLNSSKTDVKSELHNNLKKNNNNNIDDNNGINIVGNDGNNNINNNVIGKEKEDNKEVGDIKDEGLFSTGNIIIFSFLSLLILLIVYLYFANKALIAQGGYKKKKSHKSKKGQEFWSYGD